MPHLPPSSSTRELYQLRCCKCLTEYEVPSKIEAGMCPCGGIAYVTKRGKPVLPKGKPRRG